MEGFADLTLGLVLTAPGAAAAGALVAAMVQALKQLVPDLWQHGRAPMIFAAVLSAFITVLALVDAQLTLGLPVAIFVGLLTWVGVYTAAVGTHATLHKVNAIGSGTTKPAGPDG